MTYLRLAALPLPLALLAACASGSGTGDVAQCGGTEAAALIGQPLEPDAIADRHAPVRIIEPGMMVTMDHLPSRLNIRIDEYERITEVYCG